MNQHISLCLFAILLISANADYSCSLESYDQYRRDFGKFQDLTPETYQSKFTKFCWSLQNIQNLNAQATTSTYSVNQFADFLEKDLEMLLNAKRPTGVGNLSSSIPMTKSSLQKTGAPPNWKSKSSSIKNQGRCGSCWSFTTVGLYETFLMVKGQSEKDLSEQFVLECTDVLNPTTYVSDCSGGYVDFSLPLAKSYGLPLESKWPYSANNTSSGAPKKTSGICSTSQSFVKYDQSMGAKQDATVTRYDNITVTQMQNLLADGPVGALLYADPYTFNSYSGGVFTACPSFAKSFASINHAVVIVGMDQDKNYIIKNSWGTTWGVSGFGTVSSVNDCALSAYVFKLSWEYNLMGMSLLLLIGLLTLIF